MRQLLASDVNCDKHHLYNATSRVKWIAEVVLLCHHHHTFNVLAMQHYTAGM